MTIVWLYLAGAVVTLVLLRACAATRGTLPGPPAHTVWLRQARYSAVWPLFWAAMANRWTRTRRTA